MAKRSETTHPNAAAFPRIGGPALRALAHARIRSLHAVERWSERELLALHGVGPKAVRLLAEELARQGRSLRQGEAIAPAR
jgi:hypothetical protein